MQSGQPPENEINKYNSDHTPLVKGTIATWNIMIQGDGKNNAFEALEDVEAYQNRLIEIAKTLAAIITNNGKLNKILLQEAPIGQDFQKKLNEYLSPLGWAIAPDPNTTIGKNYGNLVLYDKNKLFLNEKLTREARAKIQNLNQTDHDNDQIGRSLAYVFNPIVQYDKRLVVPGDKELVVNAHHKTYIDSEKKIFANHNVDIENYKAVADKIGGGARLYMAGDFNTTNPANLGIKQEEFSCFVNQGTFIKKDGELKQISTDLIISPEKDEVPHLLEKYILRENFRTQKAASDTKNVNVEEKAEASSSNAKASAKPKSGQEQSTAQREANDKKVPHAPPAPATPPKRTSTVELEPTEKKPYSIKRTEHFLSEKNRKAIYSVLKDWTPKEEKNGVDMCSVTMTSLNKKQSFKIELARMTTEDENPNTFEAMLKAYHKIHGDQPLPKITTTPDLEKKWKVACDAVYKEKANNIKITAVPIKELDETNAPSTPRPGTG